mgnify:FL=1
MEKTIIILQIISVVTMLALLVTTKFMWLALAIAMTLISIILNIVVFLQKKWGDNEVNYREEATNVGKQKK